MKYSDIIRKLLNTRRKGVKWVDYPAQVRKNIKKAEKRKK
jgi:hypothetical protein